MDIGSSRRVIPQLQLRRNTMLGVIRSFVKVMQRRQRLSFRMRNIVLKDTLDGLRQTYRKVKHNA